MQCFFCHSPAAHPANGCQYTPTVLSCERCTRSCWAWVKHHTNSYQKGSKLAGVRLSIGFYEAATLWAQG